MKSIHERDPDKLVKKAQRIKLNPRKMKKCVFCVRLGDFCYFAMDNCTALLAAVEDYISHQFLSYMQLRYCRKSGIVYSCICPNHKSQTIAYKFQKVFCPPPPSPLSLSLTQTGERLPGEERETSNGEHGATGKTHISHRAIIILWSCSKLNYI